MKRKVFVFFAVLSFSLSLFAGGHATPKEIVKKVKEAAALFKTKGKKKAIKILNDKNGGFVWKDTYVFVLDMTGKTIAHPIKHSLVGKNLMMFKDVKGNSLGEVLVKAAMKRKGGWAQYYWPKPGEKKATVKASFCLKVPGTNLFVGAGVYGITAKKAKKLAK